MSERNKVAEWLGWYDEGAGRRRLVGMFFGAAFVAIWKWWSAT